MLCMGVKRQPPDPGELGHQPLRVLCHKGLLGIRKPLGGEAGISLQPLLQVGFQLKEKKGVHETTMPSPPPDGHACGGSNSLSFSPVSPHPSRQQGGHINTPAVGSSLAALVRQGPCSGSRHLSGVSRLQLWQLC